MGTYLHPWQKHVHQEWTRLRERMLSAESRTVDAIWILAKGSESDVDVGQTYLSNLKMLRDRWNVSQEKIGQYVPDGKSTDALREVETMRSITAHMERLASAVEARTQTVGRPPGGTSPDEPSPSLDVAADAEDGISLWALVPFTLLLPLIFGD